MMGASDSRADSLEESVAAERARTLTVRLRVLAWASIGVVLLFMLGNPPVREGTTGPFIGLRLAALAVLVVFIASTYRPRFKERQLLWAISLATGIAVLTTLGGALRGDLAITVTLHLIVVLMTAAVLPWGLRCQSVMVAICAALLAAMVIVLGPPTAGDPDVLVLINALAGSLLSLVVAGQTRSAFDRSVRENLRLRAAEERNRSLNEQLEAKVRARTVELEGALADQRAVTRAISHDLRQPLRHIDGFTRMLEEELGRTLGTSHLDRLDRVRTATARMDRMVDALLELARISGQPLERHTMNVSDCASQLCDELTRREPDRRVEFTIAPDLVDHCDAGLVRNLLRQLLANAWKFTRERSTGRIELGRRDGAYFVRDNGPGFDMQHTRRLFHAFERLHHPGEFEGEGIGLAIAQRIVRRHGGRIWAESEPGHGATFLFTLRGDG